MLVRNQTRQGVDGSGPLEFEGGGEGEAKREPIMTTVCIHPCLTGHTLAVELKRLQLSSRHLDLPDTLDMLDTHTLEVLGSLGGLDSFDGVHELCPT